MTDELEIKEEEKTAAEETQPEKGTGTDQKSTAKTFTQEEVNKIVAKEKAAWKKQIDRTNADNETIVDGLRKDIEARDELIQSQVDLLKKDLDIPEEDWEFITDGKTPMEQYQFLMKKMEKASKEPMPRTPKGKGKETEFTTSFRPPI